MKNDCLFCAIAAGEIPSNKVYEDELCYAFRDIAPQAPTHFLVIPKAHIASVSGINAENSAVVAHIFEVIAKVTKEMGMESYRVVSNIGEQAGQSVPHLHFHVLARPGYDRGLRAENLTYRKVWACRALRGHKSKGGFSTVENRPFGTPRERKGLQPLDPRTARC